MLENIGAQLILSGVGGFVSGANIASNAINGFTSKLDTAGTNVKNFGTSVTNAGNFMQRTGFILSFQLTAPLVALGKTVFNASTDFETAFTNVRKNVNDAAEKDFPILERALRDMSIQTGVSAIDLATIAGEAGQVGISAKNIVPFTETIAKLRVATNLGAEATQELARIATLTGTTNFPALGNAITLVGANTNATEKEIVHMAAGLAGTARVIGLSTADVIGLAAGFSSLGIQAEAGRGSFQKLGFAISGAVADNGKDLQIWAEVANQTTDEFATSFRTKPIEAILAVIQGFGELREEGVLVKDKVFTEIGLTAAEFGDMLKTDAAGAVALYEQGLAKVGGQGTDLNKVLTALGLNEIRIKDLLLRSASAHGDVTKAVRDSNKEYATGNATQIEFEKKLKSTQGQLDVLKAKLIDAAIDVGKLITPDVLEAATTFTKVIIDLAKEFSKLDKETRHNILFGAAVAAALAPIVVILGALASVIGLVAQAIGLFGRGIALLLPHLPKLLAETTGIVTKFGAFALAALNAARAAGFVATATFILQTGIARLGVALRFLVAGFGPVGLALTGLMLLMQHTGTSFDELKNTAIQMGALIASALVQVASHIAASFADMAGNVLSNIAFIARGIANLLSLIPGIGASLQQGVNNIAGALQNGANAARKAALDSKIAGDDLTKTIIESANAALVHGAAVDEEAGALSRNRHEIDELVGSYNEVGAAAGGAVIPTRDFGNLLDEEGKKAKEAKEEVLSAAEAFEQFINSLSVAELAAYATQTDINRIAQDAWFKSLEDELRTGSIEAVAQAFVDVGKTGMEAFEFITEALKKIQEEGPRATDEIVKAAKETNLLGAQWKFFESDAERMISEGLISQVAEQLIQMGKTGKEAIAFINTAIDTLREKERLALEEIKKLREEFVKQGIATEELAAIQRAASAAYMHDLRKEREELERTREKELALQQVRAATARMLRGESAESQGNAEKIVSKKINQINEAAEKGNWGAAAQMIAMLEGENIGGQAQRVIDAISTAVRDAGWEFKFVAGEGAQWVGPSFQHGGITPGSPSKTMMAQVHGSETIIPASLRNMEFSLVDRLLGALGNLGNQFTVNANYSNEQSPASISLDMSALMAMSRN